MTYMQSTKLYNLTSFLEHKAAEILSTLEGIQDSSHKYGLSNLTDYERDNLHIAMDFAMSWLPNQVNHCIDIAME